MQVRRTSEQDYRLWEGQLERIEGVRVPHRWVLMHIPKTAGSSFLKDSPALLPKGTVLKGNEEMPWYGMKHAERRTQGSALAVFFRNPVSHVYSQFLECKYDGWGKEQTNGTGFPRGDEEKPADGFGQWVSHFLAQRPEGNETVLNQSALGFFGCYNPWNMQARYMGTQFGHNTDVAYLEPPLEPAKLNTRSTHFVGIQELYSESLCLFRFSATGRMPESCKCGGFGALGKKTGTKIAHSVPPHSVSDLPSGLVHNVSRLVEIDAQFFRWSLDLFERRLRKAQVDSGVQVVCEDRLVSVRKAADELIALAGR